MQGLYFTIVLTAVIIGLITIYDSYCIFDLLKVKKQVKNNEEIDDKSIDIFRKLFKINKYTAKDNKRIKKSIRRALKVTVATAILGIVSTISLVAISNSIKILDNSITTVATILGNTSDKSDDSNEDSDTSNNWVAHKDDFRYLETDLMNGSYHVPGNATGRYAIQLNDGSYYYYHQASSGCGICLNCGDFTSMYWGSGDDFGMFGRDGCAVYSAAMVISNLIGQPITPDMLLDAVGCTMTRDADTGILKCNTGTTGAFSGRCINYIDFWEKAAEQYDIKYEIVYNPTVSDIDDRMSKGCYIWFYGNTAGCSSFPCTSSTTHFMAIRRSNNNGYYFFDSCSGSNGAYKERMNTPMSNKELFVNSCRRDLGGLGDAVIAVWCDRPILNLQLSGEWYSPATSVGTYTSKTSLGHDLYLYNGLPWQADANTYIVDCNAMAEDCIAYINSVSTDTLAITADDLLGDKSRMINDRSAQSYGRNNIHVNCWWDEGDGMVTTIDGVTVAGVCVPPAVIDPTYNTSFTGGYWMDRATPDGSVYNYGHKKLAAILQHRDTGGVYYFPCSPCDAKAHTFPGGVFQTNIKVRDAATKDSSGNPTSFNIQISRDWSGTKAYNQLNTSTTLAELAGLLNSKCIDHVSPVYSPYQLMDNIAEFWWIPTDSYAKFKNDYILIGMVVWGE